MRDGDTVSVVVEEAHLIVSTVSGFEVVSLDFSIPDLCFHDGRVRGRLFSRMSNRHLGSPSGYTIWKRRINLRRALGMKASAGVFTEEETRGMVGKRLCVVVEEVEFRERCVLRVADFLPYRVGNGRITFSDEEYVYIMRELQG